MARGGGGGRRSRAKAPNAPTAPSKAKEKRREIKALAAAVRQCNSRTRDEDSYEVTLNAIKVGILIIVRILEETLPYCNVEYLRMKVVRTIEKSLFMLVKAEMVHLETPAIIQKYADRIPGDLETDALIGECETFEKLSLAAVQKYNEELPDDEVVKHPTYVTVTSKMAIMLEESRRRRLVEQDVFTARDLKRYFSLLTPFLPPSFDFDEEFGKLTSVSLDDPSSGEGDTESEIGRQIKKRLRSGYSINSQMECINRLLKNMRSCNNEDNSQLRRLEARKKQIDRELHEMEEQDKRDNARRLELQELVSNASEDIENTGLEISMDEPVVTMAEQAENVIQEEEYVSDRSSEPSSSVRECNFESEVVVLGQELGDIVLNDSSNDAANAAIESIPDMDPLTLDPLKDPVRNRICRHIYGRATMIAAIHKNRSTKCPINLCINTSVVKISDLINDPELSAKVAAKVAENVVDNEPQPGPAPKPPTPKAKKAGNRRRRRRRRY
ncbi:unnamed protein product [Orchesella dallaii]|uniref:E3 SUMO-protein ligase NSE2 n=1 Tax=Orchesella dallaii TaxID=48710 RepID=A0ABP1R3F1_9HEXA